MSLSDRLATARDRSLQNANADLHVGAADALPHYEKAGDGAPGLVVTDALAVVKARAVEELFRRLGSRINDPSLTEGQLHEFVREELSAIIEDEHLLLTVDERARFIQDIEDDALGLGPLQRVLEDPSVTEIMVNGHDTIYVERNGKITRSPLRFASEEHLRRAIERIVGRVGRRIDESSPMVDARLQDGSRVNAVVPPLAVRGSSLTIRKFSDKPFTVENLIEFGSMTPQIAALLRAAVEARLNILVSGGTGTGKTTLLNVLSSFIPDGERIVTIEDAMELKLQQDHVVQLEARPPLRSAAPSASCLMAVRSIRCCSPTIAASRRTSSLMARRSSRW